MTSTRSAATCTKISRVGTQRSLKPWKCSPAKLPSTTPGPETSSGVHRGSGSKSEQGNMCGRVSAGKYWPHPPRDHCAALGVYSQRLCSTVVTRRWDVTMTTVTDIGSLIVRSDDIRGGRPRVAGTGVTVRRIVGWYKQGLTQKKSSQSFLTCHWHRYMQL